MERTLINREILDLQADRIEKAMYRMSLPIRVDGGLVDGGVIRYHLIPSVGIRSDEIVQALDELSREMEVEDVRIKPSRGGYMLEMPARHENSLPLLPLLDGIGELDPMVALVGMNGKGTPLLIDFRNRSTWNLISIASVGSGKSEMLRALSISLAVSSPPSEFKLVGIDLSGRELTVLDSLPHSRFGVATSTPAARAHFEWISGEIDRRLSKRDSWPELVLVVDDVDCFIQSSDDGVMEIMREILGRGHIVGIHLIASMNWPLLPKTQWLNSVPGTVIATLPATRSSMEELDAGRFLLSADGVSEEVDVAWMPAEDLNQISFTFQQPEVSQSSSI